MKKITKIFEFGIWGWIMYNLGYALIKSVPLASLIDITGFDYVWWMVFVVSSNYIQNIIKHENI